MKDINKYNIAFLILHYHTIEDTRKSVESIIQNCEENQYENYEIIIVDNGSKNETGKQLLEEYHENKRIEIMINEKNLGFSAGNNVGFKYVKENYKVDFIIMINNDIIMIQKNFIELLYEEYNNSQFAILGPKIMLPDNIKSFHRDRLEHIYIYRFEIFKLYIKWLINFFDKKEILRNFKRKHFKDQIYDKIEDDKNLKRVENVIIHGSCIIFSKEYIDKFDGLDERTFLYGEEELLYIKIIKNNLKSVYNPKLQIFHNEDSSTNAITKNNKREKILFTSKYGIISRKEIIKQIKENRKILKERRK